MVAGNAELLPAGVVAVVSLVDGVCEVGTAVDGWVVPRADTVWVEVAGVWEDGGWLVPQGT